MLPLAQPATTWPHAAPQMGWLPPGHPQWQDILLAGLGASADMVALYDPDDWLCYANDAFAELFLRGHTGPIHFADILRRGFHGGFGVKIDCGDIEKFLADILPRRRAKPRRTVETDTMCGQWLLITETLLPNGYLLCTGSQITRLKHTERALRDAEAKLSARSEELSRSNEELEQFAYVVSHDLREPLRSISAFAQLVDKRLAAHPDETTREYLGFITQGVGRMQRLIGDLLRYAQLSSTRIRHEPTCSRQVLDSALANLSGLIQARGAVVTCEALPVLPVDVVQATQLLQNLLSNAIKFCDGAPCIHVSAEPRGGEWLFRVRDNGIGIEARFFERVFAAFKRLHTQEAYEGSGIGLAVCKKIVQRHGGRIWVESEGVGKGSTFCFTIPDHRAPAA